MKIMIVGSDKVYAIENHYATYLREQGAEVDQFVAQSIFFDYYQKGVFNKICFKLGISGILKKINILFLDRIKNWKPDIIWVFKGMELNPGSLKEAKKLGIKLVNYNPDNPFIFTGKGSGNKYVTNSIGIYDLHFTYNLSIEAKLKHEFNATTALLPFGFEISEKLLHDCMNTEEIRKICFLGNPDKQRAGFIEALAESGVKIDLYGNNWERFLQHPNISHFKPIYGDELWKVLRKYRIQLNLMRIHNEDSHNMRSFEVPAIGGIMLAPDTTEHRLFFEDGVEVFLYRDRDHCIQQINHLLSLSETEAISIRKRARLRSVDSGYSYKDRAAYAYKVLQTISA